MIVLLRKYNAYVTKLKKLFCESVLGQFLSSLRVIIKIAMEKGPSVD